MFEASEQLDFEQAGVIRDRIERLRESIGEPVD
jgi:protein-arginine kinase activator protein McsA